MQGIIQALHPKEAEERATECIARRAKQQGRWYLLLHASPAPLFLQPCCVPVTVLVPYS